jgi:agmatinase
MNFKPVSNCFISCDEPFDTAETIIMGVPYDGTSSFRPGSRFAPDAIRSSSYGIETYSPVLDADLEDMKICDIGDLELSFGNKKNILGVTEAAALEVFNSGKRLLSLGGEHLITLPLFHALTASLKTKDICVVHLDAHADLREDYMGERLSHATVIKRISEITGISNIFQYGIRSGTKEEFDLIKKEGTMVTTFDKLSEAVHGRPVYLTVDLDVLDPSCFPGTGTPEPGGWQFIEIYNILKVINKLNVKAVDVVELSPHYDHSSTSSVTASKVVRELLLSL